MAADQEHARADGAAYAIDLKTGVTQPMDEASLASIGLKERDDLQRWVADRPELIAPDLLLVTTEFDRWEIRDVKVADRLDLLFVDSSGSPLVAELKRDKATDAVELQALKYAAYCSQLTFEDLAEEFARHQGVTIDDAKARLVDHAPSLEEHGPGKIRIRLVAGEFGPAVTSVVLWLRDYDIDIGCTEVTVRLAGDGRAILLSRQIIPLPEVEDYLVRRRRKEQEEEQGRSQVVDYTWEDYAKRYPASHIAVARELYRRIEAYVADHDLAWVPVLRSHYLGFQRPGNYYVPVIELYAERSVQLSVKFPDDPVRLGLVNPYPDLSHVWNRGNRQWRFTVPTLDDVPDVAKVLDMSRPFQPETGPMAAPETTVDVTPSPESAIP